MNEARKQWVGEWVTIQSLTQHGMHLRTYTARVEDDHMLIFNVYRAPDLNRLQRKYKDVNWQQSSINGLNIPVMLMRDDKQNLRIDWEGMAKFEALAAKASIETETVQEIEMDQTAETTAAPAPLGLYRKMALIMGAMNGVGKKGKNEHFNYKYAKAEDVTNEIRLQLSANGIAFLASMTSVQQAATEKKTSKGAPYMRSLVNFQFTLVDGETGDNFTSTWTGEADADDDKGVNKASTAAVKYFLLKTFLIHTGDQVDADSEGPRAWYDDQRQVNELIRLASDKLDPSLDSEDAIVALLQGLELSNFPTRKDAGKAIKDAWAEYVAANAAPAVMDKAVVPPTAQEVASKITDIDDIGKDAPEFLAILDEIWQDETIRTLYDNVFQHYENSVRKLMREGKFTESDTTALITEVIRAHKNGNGAWNPTNQQIMAISKKLQTNYKISLERVITLSKKKSLAEFGSEENVLEAAKALTTKQKSA